mgnify:FL=1
MSIKDKKRILTDWYREHGGLPKGNLDIDADTDTVGNVFVDDSYVGAFDNCKGAFITLSSTSRLSVSSPDPPTAGRKSGIKN